MSKPAGPTGVITLKKIADMTYEQYGAIVLSQTGVTQVTASAEALAQVFQPDIEQQMTWIEEFGSRVTRAIGLGGAGWQGGAWQTQGNIDLSLKPTSLLDGAVANRLTTIALALPQATLTISETSSLSANAATTHVDRNPTMYMRWATTTATSTGMVGIGWHRGTESFTNLDLATGSNGLVSGIYIRCPLPAGEMVACCRTHSGSTRLETTLSLGVSAAAGVYHTNRMVVTGNGAAVEFFVDGVSKGSITTNIPTDSGPFSLAPGFGSSNPNVDVLDVDYMALSQQRTP